MCVLWRLRVKVMDFLSFKQGSLEKIVETYHNSGKDFSIMKSINMETFEKIKFPYAVRNLKSDRRRVEYLREKDFITIIRFIEMKIVM